MGSMCKAGRAITAASRPMPIRASTSPRRPSRFIGLLAAVLDARGEFPLSGTLADVWPALRLPAPADPAADQRMADLLSHQEGLATDTRPRRASLRVRCRRRSTRRCWRAKWRRAPPAFVTRTSATSSMARHWKPRPGAIGAIGSMPRCARSPLDGVSSRSSTVPEAQLGWNHQWDGSQWRAEAEAGCADACGRRPAGIAERDGALDAGQPRHRRCRPCISPAGAWQRSRPADRAVEARRRRDRLQWLQPGLVQLQLSRTDRADAPGAYDGAVCR